MVIVLDESEKRAVYPQQGTTSEASASTSAAAAHQGQDSQAGGVPRVVSRNAEEPPPYQEPSYLYAAQQRSTLPSHSSTPTSSTIGPISPPAAASPAISAPSPIFAPSHGQFRTFGQWEGSSPPSFFRQAPSDMPRPSFEPMYLTTKKTKLTSGFPIYPPPSPRGRHPFAERDITEEDWTWFLTEINKAVKLKQTRGEKYLFPMNDPIFSLNKLPIVDFFMDAVSQSHKVKPVGAIVRRWNHHFFGPRHLEVVLAKGLQRLTGLDAPPTSQSFTLPVPIRHTAVPGIHLSPTTGVSQRNRSQSSEPSAPHHVKPDGPESSTLTRRARSQSVSSVLSTGSGPSVTIAADDSEQRESRRRRGSQQDPLQLLKLGQHDELYRLVVIPA